MTLRGGGLGGLAVASSKNSLIEQEVLIINSVPLDTGSVY